MPSLIDVQAIRAQIPATSRYVYLNSGWQGPSPQSVIDAVQRAFEAEAHSPTAPPVHEQRLATFRRSREMLAGLIGADTEEVAIQHTTTEGINAVLFGMGLTSGDEVITCSGEHSSVIVPAYYARERLGITLKIVRVSADDSLDTLMKRFEDAATPALRLILLSHISYSTGQLFPVRELAEVAHSRGAHLLLDAAQSVGQMPVNVRELECDFVAFPGHKWMLGPAATGALYVRRDLIELIEPPNVSHHASAFYNFKDRFEPKGDSVDKFELTTVSVPLLAGLSAAVQFVEDLGLEAIHERAVALARYATEALAQVPGLQLTSAADAGHVESGIVSFALPGIEPGVMTAHLWETARIVGRTVPDAGCTRLCFHAFNTETEVDVASEVVAQAAKHGVPPSEHPSVQVEWDALVEL